MTNRMLQQMDISISHKCHVDDVLTRAAICLPRESVHEERQTWQGSFSAVSKPIFATKYLLESSRQDLTQCTPLYSSAIAKCLPKRYRQSDILQNSTTSFTINSNFIVHLTIVTYDKFTDCKFTQFYNSALKFCNCCGPFRVQWPAISCGCLYTQILIFW